MVSTKRSYLDSYIAVIDGRSGQMIWSNSLRTLGIPYEESFYKKTWPRQLLYRLPERVKQVSSDTQIEVQLT